MQCASSESEQEYFQSTVTLVSDIKINYCGAKSNFKYILFQGTRVSCLCAIRWDISKRQ